MSLFNVAPRAASCRVRFPVTLTLLCGLCGCQHTARPVTIVSSHDPAQSLSSEEIARLTSRPGRSPSKSATPAAFPSSSEVDPASLAGRTSASPLLPRASASAASDPEHAADQPQESRHSETMLVSAEAPPEPPVLSPPGERESGLPVGGMHTASSHAPASPAGEFAVPVCDLDFSTALMLVAGQNPQVGFARQRIREAFAQLDAAESLWLPSIRAGASYHRHDGTLQESRGAIVDVNRSSLQGGFGAGAVGAGTTQVPGLAASFHLSDAIFQPRIAERTAAARQHAASAVTQDQLLAAALAYLDLLRAEQSKVVAAETLQNAEHLADLTADFARTGQGTQADADRAAAELSLRQNQAAQADEEVATTAARLIEILSLDAGIQVRLLEAGVAPIDLVSLDRSLQELLAEGLARRPELHESRFLVAEAVQRLKREQVAPLVPSVLLGMSYGGFGGGVRDHIGSFHDRVDFDALAYWEVRNLGFGERAARDVAGAQIEQARFRELQVMDRVAREISEAHAQVLNRGRQIEIAERGIEAATRSYRRNLDRIREGQGLPLEVLQSLDALDRARRDYLRAVVDYNAAQFRLHRALGWPTGESC